MFKAKLNYEAPESELLVIRSEANFCQTTGGYHQGGGGTYDDDDDTNDNGEY
jgi:hypothetical protein